MGDKSRSAPATDVAAPEDLVRAPELASLAILEAVLAIAETHILVANPQLADPLAVCDPCDRFIHDLLCDLARTSGSLHQYVRCTRALLETIDQRDVPF